MSRELGNLDQELVQQARNLEKATQELELELAQAGLSAAGIADPTPITDTLNSGISFSRGDVVGGLIDLVSGWIPYFGDMLKGLKAGKVAEKIASLKKTIESLTGFVDKYKDLFSRRREAAKRTRETRKANACIQPCGQSKWGTNLPRTGSFNGERGNSTWKSADGKYTIEYKEGYPDFKTATTPDGRPAVLKEVEIPQTGKASDFTAANKAADYNKTPKDYTWHHKEDGVTMQLVDKKTHNRALGAGSGAAHTGGSSIVKDQQF